MTKTLHFCPSPPPKYLSPLRKFIFRNRKHVNPIVEKNETRGYRTFSRVFIPFKMCLGTIAGLLLFQPNCLPGDPQSIFARDRVYPPRGHDEASEGIYPGRGQRKTGGKSC